MPIPADPCTGLRRGPTQVWLTRCLWLLRTLGLATLGWSAVYLLSALDLFLMLRRYTDVSFLQLFMEFVPVALAWIALTPAVVLVHRERSFGEGRRSRAILEHLSISLVIAAALGTFEILRVLWRLGLPLSFFGDVCVNYSNLRMLQHAANYWLIIAVVLFSDFYRSIRSGERQAKALRFQLAGAQLAALRAKLHPHFLFNTFNAIASLVRTKQSDRAVDMISDICSLLRHTLETDHLAEVSLQVELGFVDCYLEIEKARFPERLSFRREIAPETLSAIVPNMILQPLVENAVKHGISRIMDAGEIVVRSYRQAEDLHLEVRNTRPRNESIRPAPESLGIGLSTTRERLDHAYGSRAGLSICTQNAHEYCVRLHLPFSTISHPHHESTTSPDCR